MTISVVGLITARGGSKRLPRKALLDCAGKPLIDWTIDAALASDRLDNLVLSTDDEEIAEHCRSRGVAVPFMRPAELATDTAGSIDVITHAISALGWCEEHLLLLQPTSPTRSAGDILTACRLAEGMPDASVLSVTRLDFPLSWLWVDDGVLRKLSQNHDLPADGTPLFRPNGSIYMRRARDILNEHMLIDEGNCQFLVMPKLRSVDVDTQDDLDIADRILRAGVGTTEAMTSGSA